MTSDSARRLARMGGALYLLIILLGFLGEALIRGRIVVAGDPLTTANNIQAHAFLWRAGVASEAILLSASVVLALILFLLLRPVSRELAGLAVMFNLMVVAVEAVAAVSLSSALTPFTSPAYVSTFSREQLGAMALMSVRAHTAGFTMALVFFGAECLVLAVLIWRSRYMPKVLGALMGLAGAC